MNLDEILKENPAWLVNARLLEASDQAVKGTLLDDAFNHDDDSLRTIAYRISDPWAKRKLLAHADRFDAALAEAQQERNSGVRAAATAIQAMPDVKVTIRSRCKLRNDVTAEVLRPDYVESLNEQLD